MPNFKASVQYNDLKGTVAADNADVGRARKWLSDNELINDGEVVIGLSMYAGENHGVHQDPVNVVFLVSGLNGYENLPEMMQASAGPIQVRKIEAEMSLIDFFSLFKRFDVTLSVSGVFEGVEYTTD